MIRQSKDCPVQIQVLRMDAMVMDRLRHRAASLCWMLTFKFISMTCRKSLPHGERTFG